MVVRVIAGIKASLEPKRMAAWQALLQEWDRGDRGRRLWRRDPSLWTSSDEDHWMGWLEPGRGCDLAAVAKLAEEVREMGVRDILLLGMGGSSLGARVLSESVSSADTGLRLRVLDSTDPVQIARLRAKIDPARTFFVVASKSGSTLETRALADYFLAETSRASGKSSAGRFVAITDRDSDLDRHAREVGYRRVFFGEPNIGGRFSVLSVFGLVPAALSGGDAAAIVEGGKTMAVQCGPEVPAEENPAVALGLLIAVLALEGGWLRLQPPADLRSLGDWLEQLMAESTGKDGRGVLPLLDRGPSAVSSAPGDLCLGWETAAHRPSFGDAGASFALLQDGGAADPGGELFRWELATAVVASILAVNPFNQPDVEGSKVATRRLIAHDSGGPFLPQHVEVQAEAEWFFFAANGSEDLRGSSAEEILRSHLAGLDRSDFVAVLAWMDRSTENQACLQRLLWRIGEKTGAATTLAFGPRYLHSTGQYFKAGRNHGRFVQITYEPRVSVPIPNRPYDFGALASAQARADFDVLAEHGRRVLQIHLRGDLKEGLERLEKRVERAIDDLN